MGEGGCRMGVGDGAGQTAQGHFPVLACVWGGVTSACLSLFLCEVRRILQL